MPLGCHAKQPMSFSAPHRVPSRPGCWGERDSGRKRFGSRRVRGGIWETASLLCRWTAPGEGTPGPPLRLPRCSGHPHMCTSGSVGEKEGQHHQDMRASAKNYMQLATLFLSIKVYGNTQKPCLNEKFNFCHSGISLSAFVWSFLCGIPKSIKYS